MAPKFFGWLLDIKKIIQSCCNLRLEKKHAVKLTQTFQRKISRYFQCIESCLMYL
jgi:hypothetical protein